MQRVTVSASKKYDVMIEAGLLSSAGERAREIFGKCRAALITDTTVAELYGARVRASFEGAGLSASIFTFAPGEDSKTLATYSDILSFLSERQFTRSDLVVGMGGGISGDMAGFAAATYLRGVRFMQLPTTLLAMVDASVGGKTAVNLPTGKNLAGAFYQPELVLADVDALDTLPPDTYADGIAEMIKHGVLAGGELFDELTTPPSAEDMPYLIRRNIEIKRDFVAEDERDDGVRQMLNLGHTVAHAIEKASEFKITHGHAVSIGMAVIARVAAHAGLSEPDVLPRLTRALTNNSLPTECPYTAAQLMPYIATDKKRRGGAITVVIPRAIGECKLETLSTDSFSEMLQAAI